MSWSMVLVGLCSALATREGANDGSRLEAKTTAVAGQGLAVPLVVEVGLVGRGSVVVTIFLMR